MFTDETKRKSETSLTHVLDAKARAEGVLLSDDGKSYIKVAGHSSEQEALRVLHDLIIKAKERYPKEDGWIILNRERMHELRSQTEHTKAAPRQHPRHESVRNYTEIEQSSRKKDVVPVFIGWLCDGESKEVFEYLRGLKSGGHSSKEFLTRVVCALDEMYRHRREGGRQCDTYTLLKTAHLNNRDIELTLELLAAGIDHSYEESHTGVKMACIRALDHTAKKNNTSS